MPVPPTAPTPVPMVSGCLRTLPRDAIFSSPPAGSASTEGFRLDVPP